jgi:hypothetical protein
MLKKPPTLLTLQTKRYTTLHVAADIADVVGPAVTQLIGHTTAAHKPRTNTIRKPKQSQKRGQASKLHEQTAHLQPTYSTCCSCSRRERNRNAESKKVKPCSCTNQTNSAHTAHKQHTTIKNDEKVGSGHHHHSTEQCKNATVATDEPTHGRVSSHSHSVSCMSMYVCM